LYGLLIDDICVELKIRYDQISKATTSGPTGLVSMSLLFYIDLNFTTAANKYNVIPAHAEVITPFGSS
jgi:hypothetical protein